MRTAECNSPFLHHVIAAVHCSSQALKSAMQSASDNSLYKPYPAEAGTQSPCVTAWNLDDVCNQLQPACPSYLPSTSACEQANITHNAAANTICSPAQSPYSSLAVVYFVFSRSVSHVAMLVALTATLQESLQYHRVLLHCECHNEDVLHLQRASKGGLHVSCSSSTCFARSAGPQPASRSA